MINRQIAQYRIRERIGGGGMGVVYKAEDTRLHRTVVLKFLPPEWSRDTQRRERLLQEARATSALDHPNICTIYEIDETDDGDLFIAMAYYEGEVLEQLLKRGPMIHTVALRIGMGVGEGLSRAHSASVIHRDIKPANVMVTHRGEVKILDFGLAKVVGQTGITQTGTTLGTAAYMSPEQISAMDVDGRTDVWSLGVVLYEMVAGVRPFPQDNVVAVIAAILHQQPPPIVEIRAGLTSEWHRILSRALAKKRDARYPTIDDFLSDLKGLARSLGITSDPLLNANEITTLSYASVDVSSRPTVDLRTRPRRRRMTRRVFMAAVPLVTAAGAAALLLPRLLHRAPALVVRDFHAAEDLDPRLGRVVAQLVSTRLQTLPGVEIIDETIWMDLLELHGRDEALMIDAERVQGVVSGAVSQARNIIIVEARFEQGSDSKPMTTSGQGLDSLLLFQIDALAEKIAGYAGRRFEVERSVAEMTTASYEAFSGYLAARDHWERLAVSVAQQAAERSLKADPSFALAHYLAAQIALFVTDTESATRHVREAMKRSDPLAPADRYRLLAIKADLEMNVPQKISCLEKVVEKCSRDKTAHFDLAEAYFHRANPDRAIPYYEHSLAIRSDFAPAINHLGYCRFFQGRIEEGILLLERYKAFTDEANAFDSLGDGYFFGCNYREAITNKEAALAKDPSLTWVYGGLTYALFLKGCIDGAFFINQQECDTSRGKNLAHALIRRSYFKRLLGKDGAIDDLRAAMTLHDVENIRDLIPELHSLLALCLIAQGEIGAAHDEIEWMRRMIEHHRVDEVNYFPIFKFFLHAQAEGLIEEGKHDAGLAVYDRLVGLGDRLNYWTPPFERAHFTARKAWAELRLSRIAAAQKTLAAGLERSPLHPDLRMGEIAALEIKKDDAYASKLEELRGFYESYPAADPGVFDWTRSRINALVKAS